MLLDRYGGFEHHPPVLLVHGEDKAREPFAQALRERFGCEVTLGKMGMTVEVGAPVL